MVKSRMPSVRPLDYEADSRELLDVLQTNLPYLPHAQLFSWQYLQNPEGRAQVWVAHEDDTGRIVGVAAAFPRRLYWENEEKLGYVLGDFCIAPSHRSLGLAVALQRACLEALASAAAQFVFDFPAPAMLAIYRRLRIEANLTMTRLAKPLRADRKISEYMPVPALARPFAVVVNAALRLGENSRKHSGHFTIAMEKGPWGREFTQAAREWSPATGRSVYRTAEYLTWRYQEHPLQTYELLAARHGDKLRGYLILHMSGEDGTIDDLLGEDQSVRRALLAEAAAIAHQRGVQTLSVPWISTHPDRRVLEQSGFRPRESRPVVLLAPAQPSQHQAGFAEDQWYLTCGDWES